MFECEKCNHELTYVEVDMFDREGDDNWVDIPVEEHATGAYIDVNKNWCGHDFDDDDEDKRGCIRCPYCHEYPFLNEEVQTYEYDRVVMFFGAGAYAHTMEEFMSGQDMGSPEDGSL